MPKVGRADRRPGESKIDDERTQFERDVDRILYSSAFMRLAGVTQVAHAADSCVVHNRLTHSLKVASLGRGLARRLLSTQREIARHVGGIDPAVVEAAGLAHDLGHPPYGHVAEEVLNKCVHEAFGDSDIDAFEGNAQSFRVVTKLAIRKKDQRGLNLTRATLNAILKYPWHRNAAKANKWGAYYTEKDELEWARQLSARNSEERSAEAEIMNWADDMAYSTHDVDDYYRAGLVPLDRLLTDENEVSRFLEGTFSRLSSKAALTDPQKRRLIEAFTRVLKAAKIFRKDLSLPFDGTLRQRAAIHSLTSVLLKRFFGGIKLRRPTSANQRCVEVDDRIEDEIGILKQLIWHYVIHNPALAMRELGHREMIATLFNVFRREAEANHLEVFSFRHQEQIALIFKNPVSEADRKKQLARVIVDVIAEMTEHQAIETFRKVTGQTAASVLDFAKR